MVINFKEQIFSKDFPLDGAHLVAASAGTGKTYNIQNIYARLIMEKSLMVSQIQVMTFTDAATKELRERLRAVLKDLQLRFNGKDCDGKDAGDIQRRNERADSLIRCASDIPAARQQVELALLMFDNAAISTIHGFCSRALSRFAFETRMSFSVDIKDNKMEELSQRVLDWWQSKRLEAPESIQDSLTLQNLQKFVNALSGKADWRIVVPAENEGADAYLLKAAADIVNAYEADRCNRSSQTYDDLLRSMREALNGPYGKEFSQRLREEFKAALIDEFQDTDPVQYDIFRLAFLCDKNFPVFFVGDPKQAIYSFRGGDIFTYRKATKEDVPENRKYYLDTNFRSTPRLMDAVNVIFRDRDGNFTFQDDSITYEQDILASDKRGLMIDGAEDSAPFKVLSLPKKERGKDGIDVFEATARIIAQTLNDYQGTVSPKDIAILVNSHASAAKIRDCLKQRGIPSVLQKSGNVFSGPISKGYNGGDDSADPAPMARDFQAVLKAMAGMGGIKQVRTALATPFFGYSSLELLHLSDEVTAQWLAVFRFLNQRWLQRGFATALRELEAATIRDGIGFQERLATLPDGERRLTDYHQITELAIGVSQTKGTSPEIILEWLDGRLASLIQEKDAEEYSRQLESESDAVQIMTMHVSKGLQFPLVFLPECNVSTWNNNPSVYHDQANGDALTFELVQAHPQDLAEQTQEKIRQLYVAMTRAIQRTVIIYTEPANDILGNLLENARQNIGDGKSPIQWLDADSLPPEDVSYTHSKVPLELVEEPQPPEYSHRPTKGSYSSLSPNPKSKSFNDKDIDQDDDVLDGDMAKDAAPVFHIRGGALIGSCWHEILEKVSFQATDDTIRELSQNVLKSYGFTPVAPVADGLPSFLDITVDMIRKTLDYPLTDKDGSTCRLKDIGDELRLSEQEFNVSSADSAETTAEIADIIRKYWKDDPTKKLFLDAIRNWNRQIPKGFLNGYIDLLYQYDGATFIVVWKSNSLHGKLEAFDEAGIRHEMASHGYFFQYLLYAAILQKFLKETMGDAYSWEKHFGGIRYVFLRGVAANGASPVYADRPCEAMLDELAAKLV